MAFFILKKGVENDSVFLNHYKYYMGGIKMSEVQNGKIQYDVSDLFGEKKKDPAYNNTVKSRVLKNAVGMSQEDAKKQDESRIGHLAWYSVYKGLRSREQLEDAMKQAGLDLKYMPGEIRLPDAFRKASKEIETSWIDPNDNTKTYSLLVKEPFSDEEEILKHVVLELKDKKGKRLSYDPEAATISYNRQTEFIEVSCFVPEVESYLKDIQKKYELYKGYYDEQAMRRTIVSIINDMAPVAVRPMGGVYYIPRQFDDKLLALQKFMTSFEDECQMIPLVNIPEMRNMVKSKIDQHLNQIIEKCREMAKNPVTKREIKIAIEEARTAIENFQEYREVMASEVSFMETKLEVISKGIVHLTDSLKEMKSQKTSKTPKSKEKENLE